MDLQVAEVMEIGASDGKTKTFSRDVLRLEISGPNEQHFSVIDVPGRLNFREFNQGRLLTKVLAGIFSVAQAGRTTEEDVKLVDTMVNEYMSSARSVMLPVISANYDPATQGILQRANNLDKEGIRTLGVLTKPDLVDKGGEPMIIDILEGRSYELQLGWHILKNPGQAELVETPEDRMVLEKTFFSTKSPWCDLDKDQVGIDALRVRLQDILADHIRREFPKV